MIAREHEGTMESALLTSLSLHGHRRTRSAAPWFFVLRPAILESENPPFAVRESLVASRHGQSCRIQRTSRSAAC